MTQRSCGTCRFSGPYLKQGTVSADRVECRFNPPTVVTDQYGPKTVFPDLPQDKWCGKFEVDSQDLKAAA